MKAEEDVDYDGFIGKWRRWLVLALSKEKSRRTARFQHMLDHYCVSFLFWKTSLAVRPSKLISNPFVSPTPHFPTAKFTRSGLNRKLKSTEGIKPPLLRWWRRRSWTQRMEGWILQKLYQIISPRAGRPWLPPWYSIRVERTALV